jgi:PST family polysaccharide transporter
MNLRQKAVKGVVWSAIQSWGRQGIAFIVFALLARLLVPEVFGLVADDKNGFNRYYPKKVTF